MPGGTIREPLFGRVIDQGKKNVLGVLVDAVDFDAAVDRILCAAAERSPCGVTALAVHGVMAGALGKDQRHRINSLDLVTPDGQAVRWAINRIHRAQLRERVYGPTLMLQTCERAASQKLPIYLYGSRPQVLRALVRNLSRSFPDLQIAGAEESKFRRIDARGKRELTNRIVKSGARITFVGLGCPRQETFVYEYKDDLQMPTIAVGAAFDYHAGALNEPHEALQRAGLQWAYRLLQDPKRLWRRYLIYNSAFVLLAFLQGVGVWQPSTRGSVPESEVLCA